jgi:hypothetical protein
VPGTRQPRDSVLVGVSAVQLAVGVAGLVVAVRRRRAYDFLGLRGRDDRVARDALSMGTALSAPVPMLVIQGVATDRLRRGTPGRNRAVLGLLGGAMTVGYLGEALVRTRLRRAHWDRLESPVVVVGLGLATTMAALAWRSRQPAASKTPANVAAIAASSPTPASIPPTAG